MVQNLLNGIYDNQIEANDVDVSDVPFQIGDRFKPVTESRFNNLVEKLKQAFPSIDVFSDKGRLVEKLKEYGSRVLKDLETVEGVRFMKLKSGYIYGVTFPDGSMYLTNEDGRRNANTPIHEFAHVWEATFSDRFKEGLRLFKETQEGRNYINAVSNQVEYASLSKEMREVEALVRFIGDKGGQKQHEKVYEKILNWIKDLFAEIGRILTGKELTGDEKLGAFADMVLGELLGGKRLINDGKETINKVQFSSFSDTDYGPGGDPVQKNKKESGFISQSVRGLWSKGETVVYGPETKVRNAGDVADMMAFLENKSVENGFAVHVDKEGNGHVQYLSTGSLDGTVMSTRLIVFGARQFNAVKTYLVQNHPSGNLTASGPDMSVAKTAAMALHGIGVSVEQLVIDTYKKEYLVFNEYGDDSIFSRPEAELLKRYKVHKFDEVEYIGNTDGKVTGSGSVFKILQNKRFSALPKKGMLLLSKSSDIIGNYLLEKINEKVIIDAVKETGIASSVIFYGNHNYYDKEVKPITNVLQAAEIRILDFIQVNSNGDAIIANYKSHGDDGLLAEHQEKYGTNEIKFQVENDPITQAISQAESKGGIDAVRNLAETVASSEKMKSGAKS
ncbi:MAG: JAB domain-containing protein, partial [Anaerovoracaceae bacterium]